MNFLTKILINLAFIFSSLHVWSQNTNDYSTDLLSDRPGVADAPYVLNRGQIQVELGVSIERPLYLESIQFPSMLLRMYLAPGIELRFNTGYEPPYSVIERIKEQKNIDLFAIGGKYSICKERTVIPAISLLANSIISVPNGFENRFSNPAWDIYLATINNGPNGLSLNANIGLIHFQKNEKPVRMYALCLNWSINSTFGTFFEVFGFKDGSENLENRLDFGFTFVPITKTQIDISWVPPIADIKKSGSLLVGVSRGICFSGIRKKIKIASEILN